MHEMAIAEGILDIALDYAAQNDARQVQCISLLLGEMSGVETESLEFCFASLAKGTIAEKAELRLQRVPLMGRCVKCGQEVHIKGYNFICSNCGAAMELISGRELRVEYLEVD